MLSRVEATPSPARARANVARDMSGPADPGRNTASDLPRAAVYGPADAPTLVAGRPGPARPVSLYPGHLPLRLPRAALDHAPVRGLRQRPRLEPALPLSARSGHHRPLRGVRSAHADRVRLGRPPRHGRGGPGGRGHLQPRGHGGAPRRHPPRPRLHLHDHQRHRGHPAWRSTSRWRAGAGSPRAPSPAPSRTTSSRSTSPAAPTSILPAPRCASSPTSSPTAKRTCRSGTPSRSPATTSARREPRRPRRSPSPSPTPSSTCGPRRRRASIPERFGERVSFFFACHSDFIEEVAKFRAARRLWARIMRERFGVTNPKAQHMRFHVQTGGVTLTAQQPDNNVVRVTLQALAAVLGGCQSLHTNGKDEALALPTEASARLALAHAAGDRLRVGRGGHRGPPGRLLRGGGGHRPARSRGPDPARPHRSPRGGARGHRAGGDPARDPGVGLSLPARGGGGRADDRGGQSVPGGRRGTPPGDILRIDPALEREQVGARAGPAGAAGCRGLGRGHERPRSEGAGRRQPDAGHRSTRCSPGPRWARSPACLRRVFGEHRETLVL